MSEHRIAWLPGDGIGPEVCGAARRVLDAVGFEAEYVPGDIGWECWIKEGDPLPARTIEVLRSTKCAFFGAITSKPPHEAQRDLSPRFQDKGLVYRNPVLQMRRLLDLYASLRPCIAIPRNPLNYREDIDIAVFRQNSEGLEFPRVPEGLYPEKAMEGIPPDAAVVLRAVSERNSKRVVRAAFEYAVKNCRRKVTAVHNAAVLPEANGRFLAAAREVASEFPDIEFTDASLDSVSALLFRRPESFQVLVLAGWLGDVLSGVCTGMMGGPGFGYTANLGDGYAVFEPSHGSAPKYAGLNKANPLAAILAAEMMLEWLGDGRAARIAQAVADVVSRGDIRTYDMGGNATTDEMAAAVIDAMGGSSAEDNRWKATSESLES